MVRLNVSALAHPLEQINRITAFITGFAIATASLMMALSGKSLK